jgi:hypothetical protein
MFEISIFFFFLDLNELDSHWYVQFLRMAFLFMSVHS